VALGIVYSSSLHRGRIDLGDSKAIATRLTTPFGVKGGVKGSHCGGAKVSH
jgi:hypothetical protein